ncbi:MAG: arylsulfatase [Verrucomicrobiota bacterium]
MMVTFSKPFVGILIAGLLAVSATAQSTNNPPPPLPRRPSIILILADDLGYGDVGCYGQTRIKTPNIDRLAAEGIRFTSCYAGSTVCSPSRAALMLGQHTGHLKIRGNVQATSLSSDDVTVARLLHDAGYRTALLGKWGLAEEGSPGVPQNVGFDEFFGYLSNTEAHNYYPDFIWRYRPPGPGQSLFDGRMPYPENGGAKQGAYVPDLCTTAALNFIKNNKPDQFNRYRPFFLFLSYTIPHANNEEGRRTGNGMQVPSDAPYSDEQWTLPEKNKAAMITRMDSDIGRLLEQLKKLNLETNTVVIFTSDNGPHAEGGVNPKFHQSSGPLRGIKRDLYEGGIRVPMIVRWPAGVKSGQVSDFAWAQWDFLPTAADIAMTKAPKAIDGISIYPLLIGQQQTNKHDFFYWEFHERGFQQAARMGEWKAVRPQADQPLELYNLQTDLGEKQDVAKNNPGIIEKFEAYFKTARTEDLQWPIKKPEPKPASTSGDKP